MMRAVSIRLPERAVTRLRAMAHRESLRTGVEHTWSGLVRKLVEKLLADGEKNSAGDDRPA
jgi:hypothetical protein